MFNFHSGALGALFVIGQLYDGGAQRYDPNPIGPGLLFFFTAWPAIICLGIGVYQVRRKKNK